MHGVAVLGSLGGSGSRSALGGRWEREKDSFEAKRITNIVWPFCFETVVVDLPMFGFEQRSSVFWIGVRSVGTSHIA